MLSRSLPQSAAGRFATCFLDRHPLFWVKDPNYLYTITFAVVLTMAYVRFKPPPHQVLLIADAIGLSVFTIVGAHFAEELGRPWIVAVVMGTLTGTAGGVLRDMLCNDIPILFREGYLYATAAAVGAILYVLLQEPIGHEWAAYIGMAVVAALRSARSSTSGTCRGLRSEPWGQTSRSVRTDLEVCPHEVSGHRLAVFAAAPPRRAACRPSWRT